MWLVLCGGGSHPMSYLLKWILLFGRHMISGQLKNLMNPYELFGYLYNFDKIPVKENTVTNICQTKPFFQTHSYSYWATVISIFIVCNKTSLICHHQELSYPKKAVENTNPTYISSGTQHMTYMYIRINRYVYILFRNPSTNTHQTSQPSQSSESPPRNQ